MMNDFKGIIHKEVVNFLNESARIITEKWSYSNTIDDYTEYIYDIVEKTIGNAEYHSLSNDIKLYVNEVNVEIYGIKMPFYYLCYNCRNEEACQNAHEHLDSKNGYNEKENYLIITIYLVNGDIIEDFSNTNIKHELEHILQISKGKQNNEKYKSLVSDAYFMATNVLYNKDKHSQEDYVIAKLFYYSDPHEQDAFMNEYYDSLKRNFHFIMTKNSETHLRLKEYNQLIDFFNRNLTNKNLMLALNKYRIFGYTKHNFKIMIDKGVKRFQKKMNNIEKHFKNNKI